MRGARRSECKARRCSSRGRNKRGMGTKTILNMFIHARSNTNCIWTSDGFSKDIFVWDDKVEVWSASHYWNWHYDNLLCFPSTWNYGNGLMTFGINDGARSIGFL
ncbi:hypothetical protein DFJ73DRAFT_767911 [Zopfochytrium polystomum]|nr:hypothetical protein DFJ73DRAFT_767911 [Zopfochytrium polystomum]